MKKRNFGKSIQGKIFSTIILVMTLTIMVSILVTYFYFSNRIIESQVQDDQVYLNNISNIVDEQFKEIKEYLKNILIDEEIQQYMYNSNLESAPLQYRDEIHMERIIRQYVLLRDSIIVDIGLTDAEGNVIVNSQYYGDIKTQDWYQPFYKNPASGYSGIHSAFRNSHHVSADVVTSVTKINYIYETGLYIGDVLIHIDFNKLISPTQNIEGTLGKIIIFDENNELLYPENGENSSEILEFVRNHDKDFVIKDQKNYYLVSSVKTPGWTMIGVLPKVTVSQNIRSIMGIFLLILMAGIILTSLIIIPITKNITVPLTKLSNGMRKVADGDLEVQVELHRDDEIGDMAKCFNQMVMKICDLIDEVVKKERRERATEMKLLMTEINPHFIYNTLDTIIYLGRRAKADDVVRVTRLFIRILQYNIRIQPYLKVKIKEEGSYIENYVALLEYRYNNQVRLVWDCGEGLENCLIHQMLIYPLVENSVYHGIAPKCAEGTVRVKIREEEDRLVVAVSDDGVGMTGTKLRELERDFYEVRDEYSKEHIGLNNVNQRLKLLYGPEYGLSVESCPGKGTRFCFNLPKMTDHSVNEL